MPRIQRTVCALVVVLLSVPLVASEAAVRNFLLITVDDMNCDSVGVYGCRVEGITPNIDRLASQSLRFERAHVTIAVCQPTRAVWLTGRYPHRNGALGFQKISAGVPTLLEQLHDSGYLCGLMAKVPHCLPSRGDAWDVVVPASELQTGRNPELFGKHAREFFAQAKASGKPFFLMANSQDPHRPFAGSDQEKGVIARANRNAAKNARSKKPGKLPRFPAVTDPYQPSDVPVPGFLPDLPEVRREMAEYYTSVRRADRITGRVLAALEESGLADSTVVMFLSDHGMPLPFAKTNCYRHSTKTPWIVRWPGRTKPGSVDREHFISGIDLTPTALDVLGLPPIPGIDGRSFRPLLEGKRQAGRDAVFTHFHRTAGRNDYPMRAVIDDGNFGYIYNAWSDGKTVFKNESQSGRTMAAMRRAAPTDATISRRVDLFLHRTPDELFDYGADPDALRNLAGDAAHAERLARLQKRLLEHLESTDDPLLETYREHLARSPRP